MAIATTTIKPENIEARHSSGAIAIPTAVIDLGNGTYQYQILRNWSLSDVGEWKVFTSASNPVSSLEGNTVAEKQIGLFTVLHAGAVQYVFLMPWNTLLTPAPVTPPIYQVDSNPPNLDDRDWRIWHQYKSDNATWTWSSRITFRAGDMAIEHSARSGSLPQPTHADAVPMGGNVYRTLLPGNAELTYSPTKGTYTNEVIFPQGSFTTVNWKAYSDRAGTIEINGRNGSQSVPGTATRATIGIAQLPPEAQAVRIKMTKIDGTIVDYLYEVN